MNSISGFCGIKKIKKIVTFMTLEFQRRGKTD